MTKFLFQVQAIIGEDYAAGAAMADVCMMNPEKDSDRILPNTFKRKINGKTVYTNKFVKEVGQKEASPSGKKIDRSSADSTSTDDPNHADGCISSKSGSKSDLESADNTNENKSSADEQSVHANKSSADQTDKNARSNNQRNGKWISMSVKALKSAEQKKGKNILKPPATSVKNLLNKKISADSKRHLPKPTVCSQQSSMIKKLEEQVEKLSVQISSLFLKKNQKLNKSTSSKTSCFSKSKKQRDRKCYNCGERTHEANNCPNACNRSHSTHDKKGVNEKEIFVESVSTQKWIPKVIKSEPIGEWVPKCI